MLIWIFKVRDFVNPFCYCSSISGPVFISMRPNYKSFEFNSEYGFLIIKYRRIFIKRKNIPVTIQELTC